MKDSPKILEAVYWTTWHCVQEDDNINIHPRENFKSHIDVIVPVAIEHCYNYTSVLKSWHFVCVQRCIHCKKELY
jgi:hypothetical protein